MSVTHANKTESTQEPQGVKTMGEAAPQFADNRTSTTAQRTVQQLMHNSSRSTAQRATANAMNASPAQQQKIIQRAESEEELQMQAIPQTAQFADMDEEEPLQGKFEPAQRAEKPNNTGLPDNLKSGIESLSGMSMDHVKVRYNSDKPAQLQAHAYAQGSEIHVAPGQEQHLPHEAWHVVQQAQGRVKPRVQMKAGVPVNDDVGLETEADVMGGRALGLGAVQMHTEGNVGMLELTPSSVLMNAPDLQRVADEDALQAKAITATAQSEQIPIIEAQSSHLSAHIIQPQRIVPPSVGIQQANDGLITVQRKVFLRDINEKPMDEGTIRAWYVETFGQDIPAKLRNGGLHLLLESSSSVMLNSFTSDSNNFLDLIALTMTETGNAGAKRIGNEWLAGRREQIEKEADEAGPDSFDPSGMKMLINEDAVKVFIDTHQDKHQHPSSAIYGPWKHKRGTQFASGKDDRWHATYTAETIKNYALNLLKTDALQEGEKVIPAKTPMDDGYIYDAVIIMINGVIFITYHCNPINNEE